MDRKKFSVLLDTGEYDYISGRAKVEGMGLATMTRVLLKQKIKEDIAAEENQNWEFKNGKLYKKENNELE